MSIKKEDVDLIVSAIPLQSSNLKRETRYIFFSDEGDGDQSDSG